MNPALTIPKIKFVLSDFKKWCASKGPDFIGRSQLGYDCPLANYLADYSTQADGESAPRSFLVGSKCVFLLSTHAPEHVFCSEIMERIIALADIYPEGTIWTGAAFLSAMRRMNL